MIWGLLQDIWKAIFLEDIYDSKAKWLRRLWKNLSLKSVLQIITTCQLIISTIAFYLCKNWNVILLQMTSMKERFQLYSRRNMQHVLNTMGDMRP